MRIFAIKSKEDNVTYGYLFYIKKENRYFIELSENINEWDAPLLLSTYIRNKKTSVNSQSSKLWVQQRVVPGDRQNIGAILKKHKLKKYNEFELLMLCGGVCEQDSYFIEETQGSEIPEYILKRLEKRVETINFPDDENMLVFFKNGEIRLYDKKDFSDISADYTAMIKSEPNFFKEAKVKTGGFEISFLDNVFITYCDIISLGKPVPLPADYFRKYVEYNIVDTSEASEILHCSRQYINELVKNGKLQPVKSFGKATVFLRNDIEKHKSN